MLTARNSNLWSCLDLIEVPLMSKLHLSTSLPAWEAEAVIICHCRWQITVMLLSAWLYHPIHKSAQLVITVKLIKRLLKVKIGSCKGQLRLRHFNKNWHSLEQHSKYVQALPKPLCTRELSEGIVSGQLHCPGLYKSRGKRLGNRPKYARHVFKTSDKIHQLPFYHNLSSAAR